MEKNNRMLYAVVGLGLGWVCMKWMKEDVYRVMGLFDMTGKTFGIIFLVFGGWNLLAEIAEDEDLQKLLGEILALPFRLLGWVLSHWYLVLGAVLLFNWLDDKEDTVPTESISVAATEELPAETVLPPGSEARRNVGACRNLTQDASVLLVFVDDSEGTWTREEINWFINDLVDPALEYIEYYAGQYGFGISLNSCAYADESGKTKVLQYEGTLFEGADGLGTIAIMDLSRLAIESYGFSTNADMLEDARAYAGTEQVAVLFCLDKPGRSYASAMSYDSDVMESAVLYTSFKNAETRASAVAHELMHLFGAEDMYAEGDKRVNRAALAEILHPNELFYGEQWNLYDNIVGPYTAYMVGWLEELPPEYDCADWWS